MPDSTAFLHRAHAWTVFVGSAVVVPLLAACLDGAPADASRFAYAGVGGLRCLVDDSTGTIVARADGSPECVPPADEPVRVAGR